MPPPPPGMLVGYPDANQQALLVAQGMAAAAQVAPQIVGTVQPSSKPQVVGRRGDPRMHRAVEIRLANPKMTLVDALRQGGFIFARAGGGAQSDRTVRDTDNVLLYQRKNQLNRRLRKIKKRHPAASGGHIVDDNGDESDDEREDDDEEDEEEAESRRKRRGRSRSGKSKSAHKSHKKKKRRSKKSDHRSSSQQQQQMSAMMPPLPFPPIPPPMQMPMPGAQMDPASMAQFQQAYMAQQAAMMQAAAVQAAALASANNTAEGGDDGQQAGGPPAQPNPAGGAVAAMSPAMLGALMASNPMMWAAFQPQVMAAAGPGGTGMPPLQQPPAVPQFVFPPQLQAAMMQAASVAAPVSVVPSPAGGKGPDGEDDGDGNEGDAEEDPVEGEDDVKATV